MTLKQLIEAALKLTKADQRKLINALSMDKATNIPTQECKQAFCNFYLSKYDTEYYWTAKDYVAIRQLINKIKKKLKEQNKEADSDILITSIDAYIQAVYKLDNEWYRNNFSTSILNSHFNTLYATITKNKQKGVSNSYRQQVLRDLQS